VKLSAKADYAVRAVLVLAAHQGEGPIKGELVARAQDLPLKFVENILGELKHAGIVASQRGPEGGYRLAVPAEEISLAEVIRVVDGPIAAVAGVHDVTVAGSAVTCSVDPDAMAAALAVLTEAGVRALTSSPPTLEELFLDVYRTAAVARR